MQLSLKRIVIGILSLYVALQWYSIFLVSNIGVIASQFTAKTLFWSLWIIGKDPIIEKSLVIADSTRFGIIPECTIVAPLLLLIVGALITPFSFQKKIRIIFIAFILLSLINIIRLSSLFFLLSFDSQYYEMIHVLIWQPIIIISTMVIWGWWVFTETIS